MTIHQSIPGTKSTTEQTTFISKVKEGSCFYSNDKFPASTFKYKEKSCFQLQIKDVKATNQVMEFERRFFLQDSSVFLSRFNTSQRDVGLRLSQRTV
jgi:hypothetical protein